MKIRETTTSVMEVGEEEGNAVERIFVAIRVRPLNEREKARQDVTEWECVSHNGVRLKNNGYAEPRTPADTYTFGNNDAN